MASSDTEPNGTNIRSKARRTSTNRAEELNVEWSDEDGEDVGTAAYKKFKARKPEQRRRAVASARRARNRERELSDSGTGGGKSNAQPKRRKVKTEDDYSTDDAAFEENTPDYVRERRKGFDARFEKLREGGLRLAPTFEDVDFSEEENDGLRNVKERPNFANGKTLAPYKDIELPYSAGIIPAPLGQFLRDYQVKGAAFLHELFVYQKGGILGDDMGLGKTIQVIAFLTAAYGKTGDERDRKRMRKMRKANRWYPRILIVCPGSLMSNWRDELDRWGWWCTEIYHGATKDKEAILASAKSGMLEIMITTYSTYRLNKTAINMIEWDCVVADECHVIKERRSEVTKSMNEVNALCRIGLTGTAIQNKYEELWTVLNWTNPGVFGSIATWKAEICEPLKLGQSHNATIHQLKTARSTAKQLVNNLLPRFFLRRKKTLIKDQLPKKTDRVILCPLTTTQGSAYENFLDSQIVQFIKNAHDSCECGSSKKAGWCCNMLLDDGTTWQSWVFPAIVTLQKLSNHLALLIPQGNDTHDRQAKDLDYLTIAVPDTWKDIYATRDNILHQSNPEYCGKWRIIRKLLRFWYGEGSSKVLIFSHSVRLLQMLQRLFDGTESRYNVAYLDGSMTYESRYETVQNFNADPMQFVFLISTKAGGVGLNITSANKVIIVDPNWNPSYDLQAQDRAYRIGQTRDVEVYRLVSQGTIEEVVYARQIYKQQQANIGYTGSHERRYFQGVQDRKDQKGEIFGLRNLFAYENENIRLRDIVHNTNVAESKAGVRFHNIEVKEDGAASNVEDDDSAGSQVKQENAAMSQIAAELKGEDSNRAATSKDGTTSNITSFLSDISNTNERKHHDPVQAILAAAGVSYTHENSEVIGSSRVEAQLSKEAEETNFDIKQQRRKVFTDESQSQQRDTRYSVNERSPTYTTEPRQNGTETVKFKYRPPIKVQRRQLCSMASWAGYGTDAEAVIKFALFVESCTQAERREMLEKYYKWRMEELKRHLSPNIRTPQNDIQDIRDIQEEDGNFATSSSRRDFDNSKNNNGNDETTETNGKQGDQNDNHVAYGNSQHLMNTDDDDDGDDDDEL